MTRTSAYLRISTALLAIAAATFPGCGGGGGGGGGQPAVLQSIAVTPASAELGALGPHLTATGSFSDGSKANLTASAAWSSLDQAIATVDSNGNVAAVAAGSATIRAAVGM